MKRVRARRIDSPVRDELGRNEVSGETEGADQVVEQEAGEFRTEEIC